MRPYLNYAAYFPSKGAIPTLTRCLAVELGSRNPRVRVNCILPGPVMLPPDLPEEERRQAIDATLVKREGSPTNIAQAVLLVPRQRFRHRRLPARRWRPHRLRPRMSEGGAAMLVAETILVVCRSTSPAACCSALPFVTAGVGRIDRRRAAGPRSGFGC